MLSADELNPIHRQQIAGVEGTYRCWLVSNGVNSVLCGLLTEVSVSADAGPRFVAWREVEIRELLVFILGVSEIDFHRHFSDAHGRFVYNLLKAELQSGAVRDR